jgi:hypothetical protein
MEHDRLNQVLDQIQKLEAQIVHELQQKEAEYGYKIHDKKAHFARRFVSNTAYSRRCSSTISFARDFWSS